jgi:hypothetical protein
MNVLFVTQQGHEFDATIDQMPASDHIIDGSFLLPFLDQYSDSTEVDIKSYKDKEFAIASIKWMGSTPEKEQYVRITLYAAL